MPTDARTLFFNCENTAGVRAWGSAISAGLQAAGLVKTSIAGQVDWNAVVHGSISSSEYYNYLGFEVYRFSDALQASRPVFIKIGYNYSNEYNRYWGNYVLGPPTITIEVGTEIDNSGNWTPGALKTSVTQHDWLRSYLQGYNTTANGTHYWKPTNGAVTPMHTFCDGSSVVSHLGAQHQQQPYWHTPNGTNKFASTPGILWVERTRDADGTPNGNGVIVATCSYANNYAGDFSLVTGARFQMISFLANQVSIADNWWPISWPSEAFGSGASGTEVSIWPPSIISPRKEHLLGMVGIYKGDIALGTTVTFPVLGSPHVYRSLAGIAGVNSNDNTRSKVNAHVPSGAMMMRWDA